MNYKLIVKKGGNVLFEKKFVDTEISQKGLVIGRSDDAFLKFDDRAVSREHARIINNDGSLQIEKRTLFGDIRVNGQNISGNQKLSNYDYIEIPPYMIAVEEDTVKNVSANLENKSIALDLSGTSAHSLQLAKQDSSSKQQEKNNESEKNEMLDPLDDFGSPSGSKNEVEQNLKQEQEIDRGFSSSNNDFNDSQMQNAENSDDQNDEEQPNSCLLYTSR